MRTLTKALVLALLPIAANAQITAPSHGIWQGWSGDNGSLVLGWAHLPDYVLSVSCNAPSAQGLPLMQTGSHETTLAAPHHAFIGFRDDLFEWRPPYWQEGAIMLIDGTPHALPRFQLNELSGTAAALPMAAPVFQALSRATSLSLITPQGVSHSVPVQGLGDAMRTAFAPCIERWAQLGHGQLPALALFTDPPSAGGIPRFVLNTGEAAQSPATGIPRFDLSGQPPAGATRLADLPPQILAHVNQQCSGQARVEEAALASPGDLDGDNRPDYIIHYTAVYCMPDNFRGFCGAANCSIEVFLSSRFFNRPVDFLGTGLGAEQTSDGRLGLRLYGTFSICGQNGCDRLWRWNGSTFVQQ